MSYFVWLAARGSFKSRFLLHLDLDDPQNIETLELESDVPAYIPADKRGMAGLMVDKGKLYAAAWDTIYIIDLKSRAVLEQISHPGFSDLHGIHVDHEGVIWLTSTNVDTVYTIDLDRNVQRYWASWQDSRLGKRLTWDQDTDFRRVSKNKSIFHRLHSNGVTTIGDYVVISYLGTPERSPLNQLLAKVRLKQPFSHYGGLLVLDRTTKKHLKHWSREGIHDTYLGPDGYLYSTEYFGNALLQFNLNNFTYRRIPLEIPHRAVSGYITRSILKRDTTFWVGHTVHRDFEKHGHTAMLRNYDEAGRWLGSEIKLPKTKGIFALVPSDDSEARRL